MTAELHPAKTVASTLGALVYDAAASGIDPILALGGIMSVKPPGTAHGRWAEFRFGVVGHLFSAPPERGQLAALAQQTWTHPTSGEPTQFHVSTITRW